MFELETQTMQIFRDMQKEWTKAIREASETNKGIDMTEILDKLNEKYTELNTKFEEAKMRLQKSGQKKFLGWL